MRMERSRASSSRRTASRSTLVVISMSARWQSRRGRLSILTSRARRICAACRSSCTSRTPDNARASPRLRDLADVMLEQAPGLLAHLLAPIGIEACRAQLVAEAVGRGVVRDHALLLD